MTRLARVLVLAALVAIGVGCGCDSVHEQVARLDVECTEADYTWEFTITDCGKCECTAAVVEDYVLGLGCGKRMVMEAPAQGSCEYRFELVTGPMEEHGAYPVPGE